MKNYLFILILILVQKLYINSDDCFDYDSNCLSCKIQNSKEYSCKNCSRGYNLIDGKCVEDTSCDDPDCETCKNKIHCKICKSGKELKNGFCIEQKSSKKGNSSKGIIIGIIFGFIGLFIISFLIIYCCFCKKNKNYNNNIGNQKIQVNYNTPYKNNSNHFSDDNSRNPKNIRNINSNNNSIDNADISFNNKDINNNFNNKINNHPNNKTNTPYNSNFYINNNNNNDKTRGKDSPSPYPFNLEYHKNNMAIDNSDRKNIYNNNPKEKYGGNEDKNTIISNDE